MQLGSSHASAVSFPLGGIGTGNVSLGARGNLRDWEIFNRPQKGLRLPNTFFALWAKWPSGPAVTRVLEGPIAPPHTGSHGWHPNTAAGLPRFRSATFTGEYPLARVTLRQPDLPLEVELEAFTPFVPLDPAASGLPCAVLTYTVRNTSTEPASLTVAGSICNPIGGIAYDGFGNLAPGGLGGNFNEFIESGEWRGLHLRSNQYAPDDLRYGTLALATTHPAITVKRAWLRGAWYDFLREFWNDLSEDGHLNDLGYESASAPGQTDTGTLGLVDTLPPSETRAYRFLLAWHFPNRTNSWDNRPDAAPVRNHYAVALDDAWAIAHYVQEHIGWLEESTRQFHSALFNSTLPAEVREAVSANLVPLRSPTCFWLEDGRFFGFEGCFDEGGSCEGTCTHVWSYAYSPAFLFPSLEREMRRIEFIHETDENGWMAFRSYRTFGQEFVWPWGDLRPEAAVDGQMGSVLRVYREWLLSGDRAWLEGVWPGVKRTIGFAARHWDPDGDGLLEARQHTTYDIEFYGPNPLGSIYYLAALLAVAALAEAMNEPGLAGEMQRRAAQTGEQVEAQLWNGDYYVQQLADVDSVPYQMGEGCLADQLLGALHARILGLPLPLDAAHIRTALQSIHRHNFRRSFADHVNCQRTYALNDEAGLVLCTWPSGRQPHFPFVYSDEVWPGVEYQVAAHLIYAGCLAEGLELVSAVRGRFDGARRNPLDEMECGHHYVRSMSSWAVLLALSGFHCDLGRGELSFAPVVEASSDPNFFQCLWSCSRAWGTYSQRLDPATEAWQPRLDVLGGSLAGIQVTACGQTWTE